VIFFSINEHYVLDADLPGTVRLRAAKTSGGPLRDEDASWRC